MSKALSVLFRQLFDSVSCTYTYLIARGKGREAFIIDPVQTKTRIYLQLIEELDLKLVAAIDTHIHADHVTGLGELSQATNCHRAMGEKSLAKGLTLTLRDNEVVDFDGIKLKALYTPGHTDDSYSYLLGDRVLTGDTLLIRGTGRTDFQNGDPYAQYDSLFDTLLTLPEETLVYPGHDYKGQTVSTIWEEKQFNPRLQVSSREAYAELMNQLNLPKPKMLDIAVPLNQHCGLSQKTV